MKRSTKNIIQALAGALIGFFFLYLTLKDKPLGLIFDSIGEAKWSFVLLNGVFLALTFFLRALRWRILVQSLGYRVKRRNIILAVTLGYFVNSFTPKLGEIVRCASLQRTTKIPLVRSLGSVVSERIYDLLVLGIGLIVIVVVEFERITNLFQKFMENNVSEKSLFDYNILVYIIPLIIIIIALYYIISRGFHVKLKKLAREMIDAIRKTFYLRKYKKFLIFTVLIWLTLIAMNYVCLKALPTTDQNGWYFATIVLFVGGIGWALPTPGGIGTTHYFIFQLFYIFNLNPNAGVSYGVLSNGLTFIYTLGIGLIALVYFFYLQKKTKTGKNPAKS